MSILQKHRPLMTLALAGALAGCNSDDAEGEGAATPPRPAPAESPSFATAEDAAAVVGPLYEALNRPAEKDVAALLARATSDDWLACGGDDACLPREQTVAFFRELGTAIPDLSWSIKEVIPSGNRVVVRGEATGTPVGPFLGIQPTGQSFRIMSIDVHTVEGGKIVRSYHIENWAGVAPQLAAR